MKKNMYRIISWLLVIIWMIIIFNFSAMNTFESNNKSEKTINKVIEKTLDTTNQIGITDKHPSNQKMQIVVENLNHPLRKCMHATVYLILALLLLNSLTKYDIKLIKICLITIFVCIIYALLDEYHQTFVVGRTGQFFDVLIDTIGSSIGIFIYLISDKIINLLKDKNRHKVTI